MLSQAAKAAVPTVVRLSGNCKFFKCLFPVKAYGPMAFTEAGMRGFSIPAITRVFVAVWMMALQSSRLSKTGFPSATEIKPALLMGRWSMLSTEAGIMTLPGTYSSAPLASEGKLMAPLQIVFSVSGRVSLPQAVMLFVARAVTG